MLLLKELGQSSWDLFESESDSKEPGTIDFIPSKVAFFIFAILG